MTFIKVFKISPQTRSVTEHMIPLGEFEVIQDMVDGYFEEFPLKSNPHNLIVYVNELPTGDVKKFQISDSEVIKGTAVILGTDDDNGEASVPITLDQMKQLVTWK